MHSIPLHLNHRGFGRNSRPIRVLLIDDDEGTRMLMRVLLVRAKAFTVVAEAATSIEGVAKAARFRPDIVVLDIDMPGMSGLEALPLLRQVCARARIVVFSDRVEQMSIKDADGYGADLMIPKGRDCAMLVPALLKVHQGTLQPLTMPAPQTFSPSTHVKAI